MIGRHFHAFAALAGKLINAALRVPTPLAATRKNGRGGEIRTHDLYVPNVALYQAKLRPDFFVPTACAAESLKEP